MVLSKKNRGYSRLLIVVGVISGEKRVAPLDGDFYLPLTFAD